MGKGQGICGQYGSANGSMPLSQIYNEFKPGLPIGSGNNSIAQLMSTQLKALICRNIIFIG